MIPNFCGVYSINCLPKLLALNSHNKFVLTRTLIVNLDSDNLPGSHWVAVAEKNGIIEIFDSFGLPPPPLLQSWAAANSTKWIYEPGLMIQHPNAVTCGYFAYIFCVARPYFKNLYDTIMYLNYLNI
jgi:hypothetical protein